MSATTKVILLLMTVTYGHCIPGYRRDQIANEENNETPAALNNNQEELIPDLKVIPVDGSEAIIIEEGIPSDNKDVKAIRKFVESRIRSQTEHVDSNEEEAVVLTASITPGSKGREEALDIPTKNVISKRQFFKGGSNDLSDFIKSFGSIMSSLLEANLTDVRIEEMKRNPEKKTRNN